MIEKNGKAAELMRYLCKIIILAAAYYVTGRLGLLLAVPPGYATAIWPPSGVALAGLLGLGVRYWPGVILGSFTVNLFISFDPSNQTSMLISGAIAGIIACGATIQAIIGTWLVKRFIQMPNPLEKLRDIGLVILLGGPVSCLINPTISVTTLALAKAVPWENYSFNWLTWWVGDAIGIIVFTPILLLIFSSKLLVSNTRKTLVSFALSIIFSFAIYAFFSASAIEQRSQEVVFQKNAQDLYDQLNTNLNDYLEALGSIERFYAASDFVSASEFHIFVEKLFVKYPSLHALSWNQRVLHDNRALFEETMRQNGSIGFSIKDLNTSGKFVPAANREQYFPVTYAEPFDSNNLALGYDTYGEESRRGALSAAKDTGKPAATRRINIVQDAENRHAFIVYLPVYEHSIEPNLVKYRSSQLQGYAAGVFIFSQMLEEIKMLAQQKHLTFALLDDTDGTTDLLYEDGNRDHSVTKEKGERLQSGKQISFAGRNWVLQTYPTKTYFAINRSWSVWFILAGGLLFTGLSGVFLLIVTGRADAAQRLTEKAKTSAEQFELLANSLPQLVWMADETGWIYWYNDRWYEFTGTTPKAMEGWGWQSVHDPKTLPTVMEKWQQSIATGIPFEMVFPLKDADGLFRPFLTRVTPVKDQNGRTTRWLGTNTDITDQHRAESKALDALRVREEQLALFVQHTPAAVAMFDNDIRYMTASDRWITDYKLEGQNIIGKSHYEVFPEILSMPKWLEIHQSVLQGNIFSNNEDFWIRPDGETEWLKWELRPWYDADGIIGGMVMFTEVITERKKQEGKLRESEAAFRSAMDFAPIGMALVATDGKWLKVNQALCNLLGYTVEEFLQIDFQRITHPEDLNGDLKLVQKMLSKEIGSYNMQKRYFHKDGHIILTILYVSLVWGNDETPKYFISQIQDITELKNYENQREQLIEKLASSNTELERFAYVASHDMQEPLRMMANFGNLLGDEYGDQLDEEGREYITIITEAAIRMQDMVTDLLEYARIDAEAARFVTFNPTNELKHVLDNLSTSIQEREAHITYDHLPKIRGNPVQFMRLLQNLIGNGLKYQSEGNVPYIHIGIEDRGDNWCFSVHDNGIGIPQEYVIQVFQPFKRLHAWQTYKGTGIGLAICKKIVENHMGDIWVSSAEGKGSVFYFTLPKIQEES